MYNIHHRLFIIFQQNFLLYLILNMFLKAHKDSGTEAEIVQGGGRDSHREGARLFEQIRYLILMYREEALLLTIDFYGRWVETHKVRDYWIRHWILDYWIIFRHMAWMSVGRIRLLPFMDCVLPFCLLRRMKVSFLHAAQESKWKYTVPIRYGSNWVWTWPAFMLCHKWQKLTLYAEVFRCFIR